MQRVVIGMAVALLETSMQRAKVCGATIDAKVQCSKAAAGYRLTAVILTVCMMTRHSVCTAVTKVIALIVTLNRDHRASHEICIDNSCNDDRKRAKRSEATIGEDTAKRMSLSLMMIQTNLASVRSLISIIALLASQAIGTSVQRIAPKSRCVLTVPQPNTVARIDQIDAYLQRKSAKSQSTSHANW